MFWFNLQYKINYYLFDLLSVFFWGGEVLPQPPPNSDVHTAKKLNPICIRIKFKLCQQVHD